MNLDSRHLKLDYQYDLDQGHERRASLNMI